MYTEVKLHEFSALPSNDENSGYLPEQRLWMAVLESAIRDAAHTDLSTSTLDVKQARTWLDSERDGIGSLSWVLEQCDIQASTDQVRKLTDKISMTVVR